MRRWLWLVGAVVLVACKAAPPSSDAGVIAVSSPDAGHKLGSTIYVPTPGSLPPSGNAGGALTGTFPNPGIAFDAGSFGTGQIAVANGGTGLATITAHGVMVGEGTSNVAPTAVGTASQALFGVNSSTDPAFRAIASADLPSISTTGDVACSGTGGALTSCNVAALSGAAPIAVNENVIQWASGQTTPSWTQAATSTQTKGADWLWQPQQSTQATNEGGGNVVMNFQVPIGSGLEAGQVWQRGGTTMALIQPVNSTSEGIWMAGRAAAQTASNYTINDDGSNLSIKAASANIYFYVSSAIPMYLGTTIANPFADNSIALGQAAHRWSDFQTYTAGFAGAVSGGNNLPLQDSVTASLSCAASASLSNAQIMTPYIHLTGTANASTITLANTVGGKNCFDFTSVTMGASSVKFAAGTGAVTATILAAALVGGLETICCHVYASNSVSCGGG